VTEKQVGRDTNNDTENSKNYNLNSERWENKDSRNRRTGLLTEKMT